MFLVVVTTVIASIMALTMIFYRLKSAEQPTSVKKIILPPLFMSTGAVMFLFPVFRINLLQVFEALVIGMIFSIFLIKTSKLEIRDRDIYLIPSKSFAFILVGLLALRIIAKFIMNIQISLGKTSGMFFLLAFGMIVTWRLSMLYQFNKLEAKLKRNKNKKFASLS